MPTVSKVRSRMGSSDNESLLSRWGGLEGPKRLSQVERSDCIKRGHLGCRGE